MSDNAFNQTDFSEHTPQAAPVIPAPSSSQTVSEVPKPKKKPIALIGGGIVVLFCIIGGVLVASQSGKKAVVKSSTPTPMASEAPIETQGIRKEIAPFLETIDHSNPEDNERPFPPVSFDVRIKDPSMK